MFRRLLTGLLLALALAAPAPGFQLLDDTHDQTVNGKKIFSAARFINSPWFDVKAYGAVGDGVTNDTTAIQNAINAATTGGTIYFATGIYLLGTCSSTVAITGAGTSQFCLSIPSNVALRFAAGVTIKQAATQNAHLIINSNAATASGTNTNISIVGPVTFDLNKANQTVSAGGEQSAILMNKVTDLVVTDARFTNVREYALRHWGIARGYYDNLVCTDSDGTCFAFGTTSVGLMTDTYFGNLEANNATGTIGTGAVGNPFVGTGTRCQLQSLRASNNKFGFKIQEESHYWQVGQLIVSGTTGDSGIKIQDGGPGGSTTHIEVDSILTSGNFLGGVSVSVARDVSIGNIISDGDATNGTTSAVTLNGTRVRVGNIEVQNSNAGGVDIGSSAATDVQVSQLYGRNNGKTVAGQAHLNIGALANRCRIGSFLGGDDQGTPTTDRGINVNAAATNCVVDVAQFFGGFAFLSVVNNNTSVQIGPSLFKDAPDILAQRNGTSGQIFRVYGTDATDDQFLEFNYSAAGSAARIKVDRTNSGAYRNLIWAVGGADKWGLNQPAGDLYAVTDNATDIGLSGSNRPRTVHVGTGFNAAGSAGLSVTKTVRDAAGTGTCTLIYTGGILTGGTC